MASSLTHLTTSTTSGLGKSRLPVRVPFAKGESPRGTMPRGGSGIPRPAAKAVARPNGPQLPSYMRATEATVKRAAPRLPTSATRKPAVATTAGTSRQPPVKAQAKRAAAPRPAPKADVEQTDAFLAKIPRSGLPVEYLPVLQAASARHTVRSTKDAWRCVPSMLAGVEKEMKVAVDNHFPEMRQEIVNSEAVKRPRSFSFVDEACFTADRQRFFDLQVPTATDPSMANEPHDSTIFSERSSSANISSFAQVVAELRDLVIQLNDEPFCCSADASLSAAPEPDLAHQSHCSGESSTSAVDVKELDLPHHPDVSSRCSGESIISFIDPLKLRDLPHHLETSRCSGVSSLSFIDPMLLKDLAHQSHCSGDASFSMVADSDLKELVDRVVARFPAPRPSDAASELPSFSFSSVLDCTMDQSISPPRRASIVAIDFSEMESSVISDRCLPTRASLSPRCASRQVSIFDPPSEVPLSSDSDSQQCTDDLVDAILDLTINNSSLAFQDAILTGRILEPVVAAARVRRSPMPRTPCSSRVRKRTLRSFASGCIADSAVWDAL